MLQLRPAGAPPRKVREAVSTPENASDVDGPLRNFANVERALDVAEMILHEIGGESAVALGERVDERRVFRFRAGANALRSVKADDEGSARDQPFEKLGQDRISDFGGNFGGNFVDCTPKVRQ